MDRKVECIRVQSLVISLQPYALSAISILPLALFNVDTQTPDASTLLFVYNGSVFERT